MIESIQGFRLFEMDRKTAVRMHFSEAAEAVGKPGLSAALEKAFSARQPAYAVYDAQGKLKSFQTFAIEQDEYQPDFSWTTLKGEVKDHLEKATFEELLRKTVFGPARSVLWGGRSYRLQRGAVFRSGLLGVVFGVVMGIVFARGMDSVPAGWIIGFLWALACVSVFGTQEIQKQLDRMQAGNENRRRE